MPTSGLSAFSRFVPFFPFGRSFLPPLSVITSHALSLRSSGLYLFFFPFYFAPLRYAFFKVKKTKRPLLIVRWLFLRSLRGKGTPSAAFIIFAPLLRHRRQAWLLLWLRYGGYSPSSFLVLRSRPRGSLRLPPHRIVQQFRAKKPSIASLTWD